MHAILTTDRLMLRPVRRDDHTILLAHWTEPEVRRFLFDGVVLTAEQVSRTIADSEASFAAHGWGLWMVSDANVIGTAGLRPLDDLGLEVFYSLDPRAWGKGYATEAAAAVVSHALEVLELPEVLAEIDEANAGSVAVVTRLGMSPFATVPGELGAMTRYRRARDLR